MKNRSLVAIFFVVFIDLLGFSIVLPLLPFYATKLGANDIVVELIVASYALAQLLGAPLLGRLSDRIGRRPVLLISIAGSMAGFIILGFARTLVLIFISRVIDGLTGGNLSVAQAYIADVTDESNRAKGMGLIGAAFGLGFILGPVMGGILSKVNLNLPAFAAAGLTLVELLLVFFWLKESLTPARKAQARMSGQPAFTVSALMTALRKPLVGPLLSSRFFFAFAFSMFQTVFALYALRRFHLDESSTSYILAYVGFLSVIVQGFIVGRLTKLFSEKRLLFFATALMAIALAGWALAPNVTVLLIVLAPIALAGGGFNTVINSVLSKSVKPEEIGGTLGLAAALESATRAFSPALGGFLLYSLGTSAPGVFCAILLVWLTWYSWVKVIRVGKIESSTTLIKPANKSK